MTVTRVTDGGMGPDESNVIDGHWGPPRIVQVSRPPVGSLGISIVGGKVDLYNAESVLGIFIKNVVPQSPAGLTGELKTGDRILEVDGTDLRKASHEKAVEAIRSAGNPVQFLVQSLMPWGNDLDNHNLPHSEITNNNIVSSSPTPSARSSRKSPAPKSPSSLLNRESLSDETDQVLKPPSPLSNSQKALHEEEIPPRPTSALSNHPKISITDTTQSIDEAESPVGDSETTEQDSTDRVNKTDEETPAVKQKYSDDESDESSDEEDTRDLEGRTYSEKGQEAKFKKQKPDVARIKVKVRVQVEIDRASAGNVKRSKDEIEADPEEEDEFGYTSNKVKKKYSSLGGAVMMVQLERGTQGLGLSLAGHRDRNCMAVFVVGLNPSGSAHRLGPAGIQVGDEILEVNGIVLHGRCHLNASAIIKGLSGPVFKVIVLRRKSALDDLAVKPITQFPISLDEETPEEKYSNFKNVRTVTIKKGTQSLGIMIIEGKHAEVGQGIFISDIQEGSAAEQAGLDIGDMILAVNKDSLLGSSYDSAASLLKRTEGLVTLVVCNPTKKDKDAETADAKSSSRTGSRPPSAADKAGLKTSAPPSRPTTPISEPVADPATCPIVPGRETNIEVVTESKPLGLSFIGGKETLIPGAIIVHEIYPNGALAKDNRLRAGDQLLEVNGEKLADVPALTATGALRQILPKFKMTVFRPEKAETTTIDVELTKKPGKGLGLSIMARKSEPGVYVADILHGGVADLDKRIMKGDTVLSVNGQDLTNATAEQAGAALKTASGRVNIKLSRHKPAAR